MANTYSQIYIQLVFAVKGRQHLIHKNWKNELYKYICGIASNNQQKIYAINGVSDHIHILISMKPVCSLSELVKEIKASSSKWINEKGFIKGKFQWQEGYGAFSYSRSHVDRVVRYIENQETHHAKQTFKQEYLEMLKRFEIVYDERYLFDFSEN